MKLRQNESCPIQRSLVCCDREPGSSPAVSPSRLSLILVPPLPRYNERRYGDSGRDAQYG